MKINELFKYLTHKNTRPGEEVYNHKINPVQELIPDFVFVLDLEPGIPYISDNNERVRTYGDTLSGFSPSGLTTLSYSNDTGITTKIVVACFNSLNETSREDVNKVIGMAMIRFMQATSEFLGVKVSIIDNTYDVISEDKTEMLELVEKYILNPMR